VIKDASLDLFRDGKMHFEKTKETTWCREENPEKLTE